MPESLRTKRHRSLARHAQVALLAADNRCVSRATQEQDTTQNSIRAPTVLPGTTLAQKLSSASLAQLGPFKSPRNSRYAYRVRVENMAPKQANRPTRANRVARASSAQQSARLSPQLATRVSRASGSMNKARWPARPVNLARPANMAMSAAQ